MTSPFPASSSAAGEGHLVAEVLPQGISGLTTMTFQYPLKLIAPSPTGAQRSALVFLLTYGGGLVGGDQVHLQITVKPNAKLSIATQGHTKIFKSPSREIVTHQNLNVSIGPDAAMCLLPDPVQPFQGSAYEQSQIFEIGKGASVCLLDWVSNGRSARGENWDFFSWRGCNELWTAADEGTTRRLLLRDNVLLDDDAPGGSHMELKKRMYGLALFGTLILKGPLLQSLADFFMAEFEAMPRIGARDFRSDEAVRLESGLKPSKLEAWRSTRLNQEKTSGVLWSVAKVRSCSVVKFGANTVEGGRSWLHSMVGEEGSIQRSFGDDALMCIR